jgi:hypothetical protein
MHALRGLRSVHPALAAAMLAFAGDGLYLVVIGQQGDGIGSRVVFVAASLAGAGAACATADLTAGAAGGVVAAWAAATLWVWVVLGAASIGLAIVPAAVLATVALMRRHAPDFAVAAGITAGVLLAVAGLVWTG